MSEKKELSRREFLRFAGLAGTGSVLLSANSFPGGEAAAAQDTAQVTEIPVRPFGKTGEKVSCLALGGMFDIPSNQLLLKQALRWGVTYWDTADCYEGGNSERGIGKFLEKYPETRERIFLVSKSDNRDPKGLGELLERSLDRMKTRYIDLYFIHGLRNINELDRETRAWVEKAKSQGSIKYFGFSTHSNMEECLLKAAELGWIDGIMMSYNFRLMQTDGMRAAVDACHRAGIGLTAMKTQGGGPVPQESETELEMAGRFMKQGFTVGQAKLKAVWENPAIASICSQMPNMTLLMSNVAAALNRTKLTAEDRDLMGRFAAETASAYCAGCTSVCEPALASGVPVGDIMRCLMYHGSYGETERARAVFAQIPAPIRARLALLDYSAAEALCPQRLRIGGLIKKAVSLFA